MRNKVYRRQSLLKETKEREADAKYSILRIQHFAIVVRTGDGSKLLMCCIPVITVPE